MCPKPFSWEKNKGKLFSVGKSRGPLLARVALKLSNHKIMNQNPVIYLIECASCVLVYLCFDGRLCSLIQSANNHLLLPSVYECWNSRYALNFKSLETLIQSLNKDSLVVKVVCYLEKEIICLMSITPKWALPAFKRRGFFSKCLFVLSKTSKWYFPPCQLSVKHSVQHVLFHDYKNFLWSADLDYFWLKSIHLGQKNRNRIEKYSDRNG